MTLIHLLLSIPKIAFLLLIVVTGVIIFEILYFYKKKKSRTPEVSLPTQTIVNKPIVYVSTPSIGRKVYLFIKSLSSSLLSALASTKKSKAPPAPSLPRPIIQVQPLVNKQSVKIIHSPGRKKSGLSLGSFLSLVITILVAFSIPITVIFFEQGMKAEKETKQKCHIGDQGQSGETCDNLNKCDRNGACNPLCCVNDKDCISNQECNTQNSSCLSGKSCSFAIPKSTILTPSPSGQKCCTNDNDCPSGLTCRTGTSSCSTGKECQSQARCNQDSDCLQGLKCLFGSCVSSSGTPVECQADVEGVKIINKGGPVQGTVRWFSSWCNHEKNPDCLCSGAESSQTLKLKAGEIWSQKISGNGPPKNCGWQSNIQFPGCQSINHGCIAGCEKNSSSNLTSPPPLPGLP